MKTIEERTRDLIGYQDSITHLNERGNTGVTFRLLQQERDALRKSITEPWTLAYEAMKRFVADNFWRDGSDWQCWHCHAGNNWHEEWHTTHTCQVAVFQAAIAAMEGDLTPGENVVESE